MKILHFTHPVVLYYSQDASDFIIFFSVETECTCGRKRLRYVYMPMSKRPILVCVACQEKCYVEFPIH